MSLNTEAFIPFALPSLDHEEEQAVVAVLRSHWLTTGDVAKRFEGEFAARVGSLRALAVNSATAGLHLALEAGGVKPGDYVVTTPFTFTATAEVIRYLGAHPMFVDIEPDTLNIDPDRVDEVITRPYKLGRIAAILPVHYGGLVCNMERLTEAAQRADAIIVEDAAHAFPARRGSRNAGTFGTAGVFSFYATKTITTGEGGMVVTDRADIARRIAVMRLHGIDRDIWDRYTSSHASWEYQVVDAGYKYNMTDIAAAIGRVQLKKAEGFLARRHEIARRYLSAFEGADYLSLPAGGGDAGHSWHLFTLRIVPGKLRITRDEYVRKLMERGIGTSVHYIPLHIMPYYRTLYGHTPDDFPNALSAYERIFSIPIYPDLTDDRVDRVIRAILDIGSEHYKR
ncbi:MAG TPA: DegT/DnrJ/EryC1/StrS aminotransferase family protein [Spirochaetia bacterium]|nr:DegT/DnrJ/EryC1/StrS aminotransferase family protein [Spirochaetia bacterium]